MFTVKVRYQRWQTIGEQPSVLMDHTVRFFLADDVTVNDMGDNRDQIHRDWERNGAVLIDLLDVHDRESADMKTMDTTVGVGKLILVERNGESRWILASTAWLLGPDGRTIERIA